MSQPFTTVAVVARRERQHIVDTVLAVEQTLQSLGANVLFEDATAGFLPNGRNRQTLPRTQLGEACDLVVVVGGDGSLLGVSRDVVHTGVPVVGVNRGGLGFLAAISPEQLAEKFGEIWRGQYSIEAHFLLAASVLRQGREVASSMPLNDVVVHPGSMAHMMEFDLWVDDEYVYDQRSDGIILASPTGSTAYALSAGGPIMHPSLDAIVIVPMFPHTLTSRPLVVRGDATLKLHMRGAADKSPTLSCDSQVNFPLALDDEVVVGKSSQPLKLLYPQGHSFFEACRSKLDWASRLGGQSL